MLRDGHQPVLRSQGDRSGWSQAPSLPGSRKTVLNERNDSRGWGVRGETRGGGVCGLGAINQSRWRGWEGGKGRGTAAGRMQGCSGWSRARSAALATGHCCLGTYLMCFLCAPGDKNSMKADLMKVPMTIMDWEKCSKLFPKLTKNMLCAGYENESYDACQVTKGPPPIPLGSRPLGVGGLPCQGVLSPPGMNCEHPEGGWGSGPGRGAPVRAWKPACSTLINRCALLQVHRQIGLRGCFQN